MKKILLVLMMLLLSNNLYAGDVSKLKSYTDGEVLTASDLNNSFDEIINELNDIDSDNLASNLAITTSGNCTFSGATTVSGTLATTGNTTLGNGADTLTINSSGGITYTPAATWTFTGAQTVSGTWANLGTVTTADINGGTIDGSVIGGASAAAGTFTTLTATSFNLVPAGTIVMYGGAAAPTGWLACDGSAVSRTTYSVLFTAISTTYGVGDGSTTFNLPNFTSKMPRGNTPGTGGGSDTDSITLSEANLAAHTHTGPSHTHTGPSHTHAAGTLTGGAHTHILEYLEGGGGSGGFTAGTFATHFGATNANAGVWTDFGQMPSPVRVKAQTPVAVTGSSGAEGTGATGAGGTGASGSIGSGTAFTVDTLPAYTAVMFIIKT